MTPAQHLYVWAVITALTLLTAWLIVACARGKR